jgi:hypothetical protein
MQLPVLPCYSARGESKNSFWQASNRMRSAAAAMTTLILVAAILALAGKPVEVVAGKYYNCTNTSAQGQSPSLRTAGIFDALN